MNPSKLLIMLLMFSYCLMSAQSIQLTPHDNPVNASITGPSTDISTEITVQNLSNEAKDIMVSRQVVNGLPGTQNYFCWTACYTPQVSVSSAPITFEANQTDESTLSVHYLPNEVLGSVTIKYCAYDNNNMADSACVDVTFNALTVSLEEKLQSNAFSNFHPNPTASITKLDYSLSSGQSAKVVVSDMLGNIVQHKLIEGYEGTFVFDVSSTPNGLYFANIYVNNEIKAVKQLVVNK